MRVGILASLLLAPATLANANEQTPITQQNEQVPFNVVANVSERDILLAPFKTLYEESSSSAIAQASDAIESYTPEQRAVIGEADAVLLEAKVDYVKAHAQVVKDLNAVKLAIDQLAVTSPTLMTSVEEIRVDYDQAVEDLEDIQEEFRTAFNANPNAEIKGQLKYVDNNEAQNSVIVSNVVKNYKTLETLEKDIVQAQDFIDTHIINLQSLSKPTYKTVIAEAQTGYKALNDNQKKILAAYSIGPELTAAQLFKKAEDVLIAVGKADQLYTTILTANYTSVSSLRSKMNDLTNALKVIGTEYEHLLEANPAVIAQLDKVYNLVEAIDKLKVEDYRTEENGVTTLQKLNNEYNDIAPEHKIRVFNYNKLDTATKDVVAADHVIDLIRQLDIDNPTTLQTATEAYNKLTSDQKKLVPTGFSDDLKTFQQDNKSASAVVKAIDVLKPSLDTSFLSKLNAASASYKKLSEKEQKHVSNAATLTQLEQFKDVIEKVVTLKLPKSTKEEVTQYETTVTEARAAFTSAKSIDISTLSNTLQTALNNTLDTADEKLKVAATDIARAQMIVTAIDGLTTADTASLLVKISEARALYDEKVEPATSANAKKLVYNYSALVALEKKYAAVLKITKEIDTLPTYYNKTSLLGRIQSIQKAYDSLGTMKDAVYNQTALQQLDPVAQFMVGVNALKPKDSDYEAKVKALQDDYVVIKASFADDQYKPLIAMLNKNYEAKLTLADSNISIASNVVQNIEELKLLKDATVAEKINNIKIEYKKVKQKNLVTNYKDFQAIEKDYKKASKVIKLITDLPTATLADAKNYAKKVAAAQKAYEKLTTEQKKYVHNENALKEVIPSAQVIGLIAELKTSSKDYLAKLDEAKKKYAELSEDNQKKVVNASLLTDGDAMKASVEDVEALIRAAIPTATDYIQKLIDARQAYDGLSKDEQRMVSNIKDLTTREKAVKPVLKLTEDIAALDPSNATKFISQYKSALKAHEKLSFADRALVTNEQRLVTELAPIFKVMEQISLIKESSKTFVEDVTKTRAAYNALSAGQQAQISNYARLLEQELNVQGGARVDEMIRAIKGSNPKEYVANVKAAREAYNALSSANKKGVTLINDLKEEEKYIKPVEVVMQLIDGLSNPRNDMAKQVTSIQKALAKLNSEQQSFVANMSDYTDLASIIHVYELIQKLNPSDKYYFGNLQAAQTAYGKLSAEEKMRVTNYYKLQEAITNVEGVENVINTIAGLSSSSSTYFADVEKALDLYKALPSALKKQVHNYDILKNAEKSIKNAQKVMNTIDQIDPTVRSFESKVKSARKAYDKLAPEEKMLVTNYTFLTRYELELGL